MHIHTCFITQNIVSFHTEEMKILKLKQISVHRHVIQNSSVYPYLYKYIILSNVKPIPLRKIIRIDYPLTLNI